MLLTSQAKARFFKASRLFPSRILSKAWSCSPSVKMNEDEFRKAAHAAIEDSKGPFHPDVLLISIKG